MLLQMCIAGTQGAEVLSPPEAPPPSVSCRHLLPTSARASSLGWKPVGVMLAARSLAVLASQGQAPDAIALGSRAMQADAFQTTACWWLSLAVLVSVGLNTAFDF